MHFLVSWNILLRAFVNFECSIYLLYRSFQRHVAFYVDLPRIESVASRKEREFALEASFFCNFQMLIVKWVDCCRSIEKGQTQRKKWTRHSSGKLFKKIVHFKSILHWLHRIRYRVAQKFIFKKPSGSSIQCPFLLSLSLSVFAPLLSLFAQTCVYA